MTSNLISFQSRSNPGGLRGPAAGLESLAAQARAYASERALPDAVRADLVTFAGRCETHSAILEADLILADAEVA
jgi:hypothetical protein